MLDTTSGTSPLAQLLPLLAFVMQVLMALINMPDSNQANIFNNSLKAPESKPGIYSGLGSRNTAK